MPQARPNIRWIIRRDHPEVLAIEHANEECPWMAEELARTLDQRNCIGMLAEFDETIVAFMVYELRRNKIEVLRLSVAPGRTREGVGSHMIDKLKSKLSEQRRNSLQFLIPETNDAGMLFLRANGFKGSLVRDGFPDGRRDGIRFEYTLACPVGLPDRLMNAV